MTKTESKKIQVTINGKDYDMKTSWEALSGIERDTGLGLRTLLAHLADLRVSAIAAVLYNGIKSSGGKGITYADIGNQILSDIASSKTEDTCATVALQYVLSYMGGISKAVAEEDAVA